MPARKRSNDELKRDRARTAEMKLRGFSQTEIAQELGVTPAQITYDMKAIRKEWQESRIRCYDQLVSEELAKIEALYREYWRNYLLTTQRKITEPDPDKPDKLVEKTIRTAGSKKYLEGVQWCIQERCRIEGLYAAINANLNLNADEELRKAMELGEKAVDARIGELMEDLFGMGLDDLPENVSDLLKGIKVAPRTIKPPGPNGT